MDDRMAVAAVTAEALGMIDSHDTRGMAADARALRVFQMTGKQPGETVAQAGLRLARTIGYNHATRGVTSYASQLGSKEEAKRTPWENAFLAGYASAFTGDGVPLSLNMETTEEAAERRGAYAGWKARHDLRGTPTLSGRSVRTLSPDEREAFNQANNPPSLWARAKEGWAVAMQALLEFAREE